jgi:hypothetical protein
MLCSSKTNSSYTTHINTINNRISNSNNNNSKNIMTMIEMNVVKENDTKQRFSPTDVIKKQLQREGKNNTNTNTTTSTSTSTWNNDDSTITNSTLGSTPTSTSPLQIVNDDDDDDDDDYGNPSSSSDEDDDDDDDDENPIISAEIISSNTENIIISQLFEQKQDGLPLPILKTSATLTTRSVSDSLVLDKTSNTATSIQQKQNPHRRRCRFSTMTVREYPRILGDNVTVVGPPISISWDHDAESVYDLEEYLEAVQYTKRTQAELKMPSKYRDTMLREYGYSRKEIQDACRKSTIARNQRKRTIETIKLQPYQEFFEKVKKNGKKTNPIRILRKIKSESSFSPTYSMGKRKTI